jgi:hypothetical protein
MTTMNASMDALEIRNMSWPSGAMFAEAVPSRGLSIRVAHLLRIACSLRDALELRVSGE